jgi:WSC domain
MLTNAVCTSRSISIQYANVALDCGNSFANGGGPAPDGSVGCNMVCAGNSSEYCGGGNRLNAYQFGPLPGWASIGCYNDTVGTRALTYPVGVVGGYTNMTNENCMAACLAAGYTIAGTEYSQECWCDNSFKNSAAPMASGCSMACQGNSSEICGGGNRLTVYNYTRPSSTASSSSSLAVATPSTVPPPGWNFLGCYTDQVGVRTLGIGIGVSGGMTVEKCVAACAAASYPLAGVEYAQECYCDTAFRNGGGPAPDGSAGCNMACQGNSSETCGGSNRLDVYQMGTAVTTTTSATSASSTKSITSASTTGSTTSILASPTPISLPSNWTYQGCWQDNVNNAGRVMIYEQPDNSSLTIELCVNICIASGYNVAGAEYSYQCFW